MELFSQRSRKALTSAALAFSQLPQTPVSGPRVMPMASTSNSCTVSLSISGLKRVRLKSMPAMVFSTAAGMASAFTAPASTTGISARRNGRSLLRKVAKPLAAYVPAVASAGQVFTSGQLPTVNGTLIATGSRYQREVMKETKDSPELAYKDIFRVGKNRNDPVLVKQVTERVGGVVDWLVYDLKIPYGPAATQYPDHSANRQLGVQGLLDFLGLVAGAGRGVDGKHRGQGGRTLVGAHVLGDQFLGRELFFLHRVNFCLRVQRHDTRCRCGGRVSKRTMEGRQAFNQSQPRSL